MMAAPTQDDIATEEEMLSTATRSDATFSRDGVHTRATNQNGRATENFTPPSVVNEIENTSSARPSSGRSAVTGSIGNVTSVLERWSSHVGEGMRKLSRNLGLESTHVVVRNPILFLFGDSLTERGSLIEGDGGLGWVVRLSAEYGCRADVLNRGFSGYNSRWGLRIFPRLYNAVDTDCVQIVTLWFGTNDSVAKGQPQHVPVEEYRHNLARMILYAREQSQMKVTPILITPPPVHEEAADQDAEKNGKPIGVRTNSIVKTYVTACVELARQVRVPCVNIYSEMSSQPRWEDYLSDGVHLSSTGNQFVAEAVARAIKQYAKQIDPKRLARSFPDWSEIDPENPAKTLGVPSV